ncbi:MAG: hypothetical protein WD607_02735 [Candidatus Paceibacterota bacterium]
MKKQISSIKTTMKNKYNKLTSYCKRLFNDFKYLFRSKEKESERDRYFLALADILYHGIRIQDEQIAVTIYSHIDQKFKNFRRKNTNNPKPYNASYYQVVNKIAEEIINIRYNRFGFLENACFGGHWLIGQNEEYPIQEKTFQCLWNILKLSIEYDREDLFMRFWKSTTQHLMLNLARIPPEYETNDNGFSLINEKEIKKRDHQREDIFDFAIILGALVLKQKKFTLLKKMFAYTNSEPPKYELLPKEMNDIFKAYFEFRNPHNLRFDFISYRFPFPDLDGVGADKAIINWVINYLAILFIRQYSLHRYLTTDKPTELPDLPDNQRERKEWIDNIEYFKSIIINIWTNQDMMESLGFSYMNDEWCEKNDKDPPKEFFKKIKNELQEEYKERELKQDISKTKKQLFFQTTGEKLNETFDALKVINNPIKLPDDLKFNRWYTRDITSVLDRNVFLDDVAHDTSNFDTVLAKEQSLRIKVSVIETFSAESSHSYVLNSEDLFKAVDKTCNFKKADDLIIVNARIHLPYLINVLEVDGLEKNNYKGIEIINHAVSSRSSGRALYLLKKSDLPKLNYKKPEDDLRDKFQLEQIGKSEYNIFASVIDLYKNDDFRKELEESEKDLKKKVYIYIYSRLELAWKTSIRMIELKQFESVREKGITDSVDAINVYLEDK